MGKIIVAIFIGFLFICQQVFSSKSSKPRATKNNKKRRSDFTEFDELEEFSAVDNSHDTVDASATSCLKRMRKRSSSKFHNEEFLCRESNFEFEYNEATNLLYSEEELIKRISDFRRKSLRSYCQRSHPFKVFTDRSRIFQSIYGMVKGNEEFWYSRYISPFIVFEGESGVDQGGLTTECIEILIESFIKSDDQRILNENFYNEIVRSSRPRPRRDDDHYDFTEAIFIELSSGIYVPNTRYPHTLFKFIGSFFALAFILDIPLGIEFLPSFYRTLTGEQTSDFVPTEDELEYIDKGMFDGLKALREEMDLEPLKLEIMGNEVTSANLEIFIQHEVDLHCYRNYKQHLDSFKEGFFSLIESNSFEDLNVKYQDLREIMKGNLVLTAEDFFENVNVSRLTDPNSLKWIFEIIEEFSDQERLLLFKFMTARRLVPYKGLKNLMNPLSFVSIYLPNPSHLPTASTCESLMKIPVYPNKESLKEKLMMAIYSCETFDLE